LDTFCGIDWAEDHHDIALADRDGGLLARLRVSDDAAGLARLMELLAEHGDSAEDPIPVAIETPRGLLVACLRATRRVYPVNPMAVARYRDRHSVAGRKSDHGDAVVLANILRTDLHAHRPLPADSELAQAIAVLARAQQDAVWDRVAAHNKLRSHLREYYPGFLAAFASAKGGIMRPEARTVLAAAPTPACAAKLTLTQLRGLLKKAGRSRGIDTEAQRLRDALRQKQMRQLPLVEQAMGRQSRALLRQLDAACQNADDLEAAAIESFSQHPDAGIITSFPGIGALTGYSPRSETTGPASRMPEGSRPTPGPPPSRARAASQDPSPAGTSRTTASPQPATSGRSPPSPHHPAPAPTTTVAATPATGTPQPNAISSAVFSAASTTA
jgi:hypothetical protein